MARSLTAAVWLLALLVGLVACRPAAPSQTEELTVFAAASLTESLTEVARAFEQAHPSIRVVLRFGPSSGLARQLIDGAPADVFASADATAMAAVVDAGRATAPAVFARNTLALLVAAGNPRSITRLTDLARPDIIWVICAPEVPCGRLAADVLQQAGVTADPASFEADVKGVVAKVLLGEADTGIVYATDAIAIADRADAVVIPRAQNASTAYPVSALVDSAHPAAATAFTDFVVSRAAQRIFSQAGFALP